MDCIEAIRTRRSVRQFASDPINPKDLETILEAGNWAPTAGNLQPYYLIVVKDEAVRLKLQAAALDQVQIGQAPVVIIVCVDPERSSIYGDNGRNRFCLFDAANVTENILLAATALGYGSCWMAGFQQRQVKEILNIPDSFNVISMIPIGKSVGEIELPERRPLAEVVRYEKWEEVFLGNL